MVAAVVGEEQGAVSGSRPDTRDPQLPKKRQARRAGAGRSAGRRRGRPGAGPPRRRRREEALFPDRGQGCQAAGRGIWAADRPARRRRLGRLPAVHPPDSQECLERALADRSGRRPEVGREPVQPGRLADGGLAVSGGQVHHRGVHPGHRRRRAGQGEDRPSPGDPARLVERRAAVLCDGTCARIPR